MILDQSFAALKTLAESEIAKSAVAGRRALADSLCLTIRRISQAQTDSEIGNLLINADPLHARKAACLVFDGDQAHVSVSRGIPTAAIAFPIHSSPSLVAVIETRDMVTASSSASELSEPLHAALTSDDADTGKAHLIPVVVQGAVRMVLIAVEEVDPASFSILCEAAAMRLELLALNGTAARTTGAAEPEPLVQITGSAQNPVPRWADLNAAEQSLHLRAQRFAQVAVARMRVEQQGAVRQGQDRADLYGALRSEIDKAREEYRAQFLTGQSKTMVDYLYLELVRSLANEQDQLLGPGFPGRLI
jgi:hypothetical protein